jgi:hypothetical protein
MKCEQHGRQICSECIVVDDAAKRAYDVVAGLATFMPHDVRTKQSPWVAIRLSDGGSDGVAYDSKQDAVRHQLHEQQCAYFSFRTAPNGFRTAKEAAMFLEFHRQAYDAGMRLVDPDDAGGGPDLIMPDRREHLHGQLRRLANLN